MKKNILSCILSLACMLATLQLSSGTDIYTVNNMLGNTNVKTTQTYSKVVDEKKEKAAHAIRLNIGE